MTSLPPKLLDQLLTELSTLASVYHKPPETFVGQGRFGADAIQHAAIQEQRQNAVDNPIAAAVAGASNGAPDSSNNENLLDIDFDGAAPASADLPPKSGLSGLEGLSGTPQRIASPAAGAPASSMDDMMGLFDSNPAPQQQGANDLMNGFSGLDLGGTSQAPSAHAQLQPQQGGGKATNEDLLGMF